MLAASWAREEYIMTRGTRTVLPVILLLNAAGLSGCATSVGLVIPSPMGLTAPARPSTCRVDFFWTRPDRPFQELAAVFAGHGAGIEYRDVLDAIRVKACELGGDAVILKDPGSSQGIVIRYLPDPSPQR
jgi:hypothetical protein